MTPDKLDDLLATPPPRLQWMWVSNAEERNPDQLPPELTPSSGCPHCGAAFVELEAVAIRWHTPLRCLDLRADGGKLHVSASTWVPMPVRAVRLICSEGHDSEHAFGYASYGYSAIEPWPRIPAASLFGRGN